MEYEVRDDYSYANIAQSETYDIKNVPGSNTIQLPDGCTKIVTYTTFAIPVPKDVPVTTPLLCLPEFDLDLIGS